MKFFNREKEIDKLHAIRNLSKKTAQLTLMVGRRRIGKTSLLNHTLSGADTVYLFVSKKNEALLCAEFLDEVKSTLDLPVFGDIKQFKQLFELLLDLSTRQHFTLIIDEFQDFNSVNPSIFSDMQNLWDRYKEQSKINLIVCGSVYSMMTKIFEHSKEPLFGRATQKIHLKPFSISTLKAILEYYSPKYDAEDLLAFYLFTGGVAKYVELLVQQKAFTKTKMINTIFTEDSLFLDEGRNVLIEEFGKEYGNYFSVLSLIASGKSSRPQIESITEMDVGGFLDRLENTFQVIRKKRPIFAKPNSRRVKYYIEDNFLSFWFRFIYKYKSALEISNFDYVKEIVLRDYNTYSGFILEKYFKTLLAEQNKYGLIGSYWQRGYQNEIDIVAVNDLNKEILFAEVKRNADKINLDLLEEKSQKLLSSFKDYKVVYKSLSMREL